MKTILSRLSKAVLLITVACLLQNINAQTPQKMSYQAVIRNSSGQLVTDHVVGIKITLLQGSVSGTVVYTETKTPTTNSNGLISIEIGGGAGFNTINWAGSTYFIKTETDPTGGTNYSISGSSQLLSVPYALYAANSGSSSSSWGTAGNAGTNSSNNYIGTSDDKDLIFKRNSVLAGSLSLSNTAYGVNALPASSGGENTAIGSNALHSNTTGSENIAAGLRALYSNTTGGGNSAFGMWALKTNTTGEINTAVGVGALGYNLTGNYNTANGAYALYFHKTGDKNTANGYAALYSDTTGTENTATGHQSLYSNISGTFNTANGSGALYNATGGGNTAIGKDALKNVTTGGNNIGIGWNSQVPNPALNDQVRIGNANITYAGVQVAWTIGSDKRWKTEIKQSDLGLTFIKKLKPVSYIRLNDESKKTEYGFIAQEVEETLNSVGVTNSGFITKDAEGMYNLRYNDLIAPMVKAIQELIVKVDALEKNNAELVKQLGNNK